MPRRTLNDRLREVPPCSRCRATNPFAADEQGNAIPGRRCDCPHGRLLEIADKARAKRQGLDAAA